MFIHIISDHPGHHGQPGGAAAHLSDDAAAPSDDHAHSRVPSLMIKQDCSLRSQNVTDTNKVYCILSSST